MRRSLRCAIPRSPTAREETSIQDGWQLRSCCLALETGSHERHLKDEAYFPGTRRSAHDCLLEQEFLDP